MSERLSDEQREALRLPLIDAIGPWEDGEPFDDQELTDEVLMPALAPVVARMLADARAEALREAADAYDPETEMQARGWVVGWLLDRADRTDPARNPDRLDATEETP